MLLRLLVLALAASTAAVVAGPVEDHDVTSDDYYRVLGLPRDCEASLVKKHYRKLAMHWHPDKNKAPEAEANFKIIAEAYEVLSNDDARKKYDAGGKDALKPENQQQQHRGGGSPFNFNFGRSAQDIFKDAFDGKDPFENFEEFFGGDFVEEVIIEDAAVPNGGAPTCEDESGIVATDENGQNYRCAEAKQFCHNAQLAEKCKRTCGKCPSAAVPGFGAQGSLHDRLRRGNLGGGLGGGFGALHDMMRGMGGGLGAGAGRSFSSSFSFSSSSSSFSSFSSSSSSSSVGGVSERTETVIENGKRVTKTIRTGADGETHASIEESEGGVTRKRSGVKRSDDALPDGGGR